MTALNGGPAWRVVAQRETIIIDPAGKPADVWEVTFQIADGTTGTVQIPKSNYNVKSVAAAITAQAAVIDGVSKLAGGQA